MAYSLAKRSGIVVGDELLTANGRPWSSIPEHDVNFVMRRMRPLRLLFGRSSGCSFQPDIGSLRGSGDTNLGASWSVALIGSLFVLVRHDANSCKNRELMSSGDSIIKMYFDVFKMMVQLVTVTILKLWFGGSHYLFLPCGSRIITPVIFESWIMC